MGYAYFMFAEISPKVQWKASEARGLGHSQELLQALLLWGSFGGLATLIINSVAPDDGQSAASRQRPHWWWRQWLAV